ncbi:MAG: hypothetical protein IPP29_11335 [Bacteroidetes bacterium]|nr:hypothetical protein [Bacteroidota bacterium]MBL0052048.1 hypothetical protein [Bacteroidota bacterium]
MTINAQRKNIIDQLQLIDDKDLLSTIQTVIEYGVKKSNFQVISMEEQTRILKIKSSNREEDFIDEEVLDKLLDS